VPEIVIHDLVGSSSYLRRRRRPGPLAAAVDRGALSGVSSSSRSIEAKRSLWPRRTKFSISAPPVQGNDNRYRPKRPRQRLAPFWEWSSSVAGLRGNLRPRCTGRRPATRLRM